VWNLRTKRCFTAISKCLADIQEQIGFRVVHYSVQGNHLHLLVEAKDTQALSRGVQGLKIRLARALNRVMERKGKVFADRYHARILRTPTETFRCLMYILKNARKHAKSHGRTYPPGWVDPYSSAVFFEPFGRVWVDRCAVFPRQREVSKPRTWLVQVGWELGGRADPNKIPGSFR
jgi:putative transposase